MRPGHSWQPPNRDPQRRAEDLAEWHLMLLSRLLDSSAEGRLATYPALGGPELTFLQARLAHQRSNLDRARALLQECLAHLPGHTDFLDFAAEIGVPLPPRVHQVTYRRA